MGDQFIRQMVRAQALVAWIPSLFAVVFVAFALHVRILLGRWPQGMEDNPYSFLLGLHEWALIILLFSTLAAMELWPLLSIFLLWWKQYRIWLKFQAIFALPLILFILINIYDPFGYLEWFWD